ncbi:MAG: hypothetical protein JNL34_12840 [Anaerolineae bacterium]|nr:hypothetical protein [Anaerolineae bacterium]
MNSSKLIGIVLAVVGFGIALIGGLWLSSQLQSEALQAGGALLGAGLLFIPVALLVGGGIYLLSQGSKEQQRTSEMQRQRQLLDIVRSRGQVSVQDVAVEMGIPLSEVKSLVHQLVGLQVFSGYVNWDDGTLYSVDASQLRTLDKCKNCGGELRLSGKGVVTCRFCGTEYFLT